MISFSHLSSAQHSLLFKGNSLSKASPSVKKQWTEDDRNALAQTCLSTLHKAGLQSIVQHVQVLEDVDGSPFIISILYNMPANPQTEQQILDTLKSLPNAQYNGIQKELTLEGALASPTPSAPRKLI